MKKLLVLSSALLTALGMSADPITPTKAMQLAQEYMVPGHQMMMTMQAKSRKASTQNAPYYIISRGENQGFVIVAGDDCLPEVLGYTDQGDFDATNLPEALQDMLEGWANMVEQAQADGSNVAQAAARKAAIRKAPAKRTNIAPFVSSHWHQSSPYNDNCPTLTSNGSRAATGCVATAASQILYYWRRDLPSTLQATTPTYGYGDAPVTRSVPKGTPLKWDLMQDSYGAEPQEYKQAVAEFVFATGAATWLTYGSSTSGNIEKVPYTFSAYFGMNGGTVHYRDSYSQEAWTQLLYDELVKGHPVMYTGVHPDNGGHAVFIHGYQASTDKFYFNFGWGAGNGYDGYYTTTQTDGMNGFYGSQSALIGACPKTPNVEASIQLPANLYSDVTNNFIVTVKNSGTLPITGLYFFANTTGTKPSTLSTAKSSLPDVVVPTDGSTTVTLSACPTNTKSWTFFVTDANLNVLTKLSATPEEVEADLHLKDLTVLASSDVETFNGADYQVVYNDKTTAVATVYNASSIGNESSLRMLFEVYDADLGGWTSVGYKSGKIEVDGLSTGEVSFSVASTSSCPFEVGKYYRGRMADEVDIAGATTAEVRFVLKDKDMELVSFENGCMTLKGHFDATLFNSASFAKKSAYKTATVYDLTQCTGVKTVAQEVNPNALYYVADDSEAAGTNVVKAGKCAQLSLMPGFDFTPRAVFEAEKATITIGTEAAKWYLLTAPFAAVVPDGIVAREITGHQTTGISNKTVDVTTLEAGKTYLIMTSSPDNITLTGSNVQVMTAPVENTDAAVVGTLVTTTTPAGAQLLNDEENQFFVPVEEGMAVEALRGYWCATDLTKTFRAYSNLLLDPAYVILAQNITEAYQILSQYKSVVTTEAYASYLAEIQEAAREFSHRAETELTTSSKIKAYAAQLLTDGDEYKKQLVNMDNVEIDCTDAIVNPSFEKSASKATGWTLGTKEGYTSVGGVYKGNAANDYRAVGLDGTNIFQSLIAAADSSSVGISQTVEGLKPGFYCLTAMVGTDEFSTVTLFAGDSTATVKGHAFGHLYLTKAAIDRVKVLAAEGSETGSLTIGIKQGRWYKADNFTLTYVGTLSPEDDPVAIESVADGTNIPAASGIYTLQGVKVKDMTSLGIYIVDGQKIVKK